jgi:hypothetical protein
MQRKMLKKVIIKGDQSEKGGEGKVLKGEIEALKEKSQNVYMQSPA